MSWRGINNFCSAQRCCKPSGTIFWVGCSECRKWIQIKCVGFTKKQPEEKDVFCRPCQIVDTCTPLPLTVDTLVAITKENHTILERVPKHARFPLAKLLNEALDGIVAKPQDESCWVSFFLQFCAIMKQPKRSGNYRILIWGVSIARISTKVELLAILSSRVN